MQERVMVLTSAAIYNLEPNTFKMKRRIALKELTSISLSSQPDNFFALHVPSQYDYLLFSKSKTELVLKLLINYECLLNRPLPINISDKFEYRPDVNVALREVVCTRVENGVQTQIRVKQIQKDIYIDDLLLFKKKS